MNAPHTLRTPLNGIRVVEFEGLGPGPLAAMMLADMGAEVTALARAEQAAGAQSLGGAAANPLHRGKGDRKSNRMSTSMAHVWGVSGMHTGDCWVDFSKPVARDFSV